MERHAIGIVQLVGTIVPGESRDLPLPLPLVGQQLAGHETIAQALRRAESSSRIKAIVFYVDSPGGSAIASDLIWHEVSRVQRRKPVVVCMGNVAASGGYYVACGAQHIVAGATTLTGSIGVIAGKIDWHGLLEKASIHREIIRIGATASMPSTFVSYSDQEWELLRRWMDEIYQRFKARVAAGRGRSLEAIDEVARGRVWTGRQALEPRSHRRGRRYGGGSAQSQRAGADSVARRCPRHDYASNQSCALAVCGASRLGASAEEPAATVDRARSGVDATRDARLLICHSSASSSCPCRWLLTAPKAPVSIGTPER